MWKNNEETLCRQIYEEGELREWPGLGQEVREICTTLDIPDVNKEFIPKSVVKTAVHNHHYKEMMEEINKMKKLDPIKHEDFREAQKYLQEKSIENGRAAFKVRSQMLENIPGNFKYSPKFFRNDTSKQDEAFTRCETFTGREKPKWH